MGRKWSLAIVWALAVPAGFAAPDEKFIMLRDATMVTGQLLSCTDTELTGITEDGEEKTFKREELAPSSWYAVRTRTAGEDAKARLELAKFCLANSMSGNAENEAARALALDPSLAEAKTVLDQAREDRAATLLVIARNAQKRGNDSSALRVGRQILLEFGSTKAAAEAQALIDAIASKADAAAEMHQEINQPLTDAQIDKMRDSDPRYQDVQKHLKSARASTQKGFTAKGSNAVEQAFRSAIDDYRDIVAVCDKVLVDEKDQPVVVKRVTAFREKIVNEQVEAYVNLAGFFTSRTSFPDATKIIREGLSKFPDNRRLKDYLAHIDMLAAIASSERQNR